MDIRLCLFSFSALLRYSWHIILCKFKVYNTKICIHVNCKMSRRLIFSIISHKPLSYASTPTPSPPLMVSCVLQSMPTCICPPFLTSVFFLQLRVYTEHSGMHVDNVTSRSFHFFPQDINFGKLIWITKSIMGRRLFIFSCTKWNTMEMIRFTFVALPPSLINPLSPEGTLGASICHTSFQTFLKFL